MSKCKLFKNEVEYLEHQSSEMGNTGSHITSGVKAQAAGTSKDLYKYIDLGGGGELVDLMKKANRSKDYSEVDIVMD